MRTPDCLKSTCLLGAPRATLTLTAAGRQIPVRFLCASSTLLLIGVVCSCSVAVADYGEQDDYDRIEFAENDDPEADFEEAELFGSTFDDLVSADNWEDAAAAVLDRLTLMLQQRVDSARCADGMTDAQHGKLLLAGRGDIKRLIDRVDAWRRRSQSARGDDDAVRFFDDRRREAISLKGLLEAGPFDETSIFARTMRNILTVEQIATFETIRQIEQDGGQFTVQGENSNAEWGICLTQVQFPGKSLASLKNLKNLRFLSLDGAPATDADLTLLTKLTSLGNLDLSHSLVTDQGLVHLQPLTRLKTLRLDDTQITSAAFQHLREMPCLEQVSIAHTNTDDAGLAHLATIPGLRSLDLRGTRVTDSGMQNLRRVAGLERLDLDGTDVTDAGLDHLKRLKNLEFLSCRQTKVTHAGIATLRRWRPRLIVED